MNKFAIIGILLCVGLPLCNGSTSHRLVVSNVSCSTNEDYVFMNATADKFNGINIHAELLRDLPNIVVNIRVSIRSIRTSSDITIFDKKMFDYCRFLNDSSADLFLKSFYDLFGNYGHFPLSCPIKKGIYYGYNSNLNMDYLPIYMPDKRLRCHVEVFYFPDNIKINLMTLTMFAESIRVTTVNAGRRVSRPNRK